MINDEARIQVLDDCNQKLQRNTSIRLQWKLRSGIQVSKSVQRKLHSKMYIRKDSLLLLLLSFFFFLKRSKCRETELKKWNKGISGL